MNSNRGNLRDAKSRHRIVAIDDSPEVIDEIRASLTDEFRLFAAINGEIGLKLVRQNSPDLILLDVMMPGMDGFEVCRRLKADPGTRDIPVIFVTGLDNQGDEVKGFELGAVDFINKPIEPVVLRSRVRTHAELAATRHALSLANDQLAAERELIAETIDSMRKVHRFIDEHLSFVSRTGDRASGDLVFSAKRPNGEQHVLLGDFTGHGLPAAIGTPLVSYIFYSMTAAGRPITEILTEINNLLVHQLPVNIFMVAVGLSIPAGQGPVRVWSFGAPDVLWRTAGAEWRRLSAQQPPMGIVLASGEYACDRVALGDGDSLFVMSDGPIETVARDGEMVGVERLIDSLERHRLEVGAVIDEVYAQASPAFSLDDITLLRVSLGGTQRCLEQNHD